MFRTAVKSVILLLPVLILAGCFIFPPDIIYSSYLVPNIEMFNTGDSNYSIGEDGITVSYDIEGSRVDVTNLTNDELNELFPDDSVKGKLSTNPYTYGNWVDPNLGFTPSRFTVFRIRVYNYGFGKMLLEPYSLRLYTPRGEILFPYSVSIAAEVEYGKSFESYYKSIRGQSGNEFYRFNQRIGLVRGKAYGLEEMIFKGEQYEGLIAFETLHDDVNKVKLVINDLVLRFDAYDRPADMTTIEFYFDRKVDIKVITREDKMRMAQEQTTMVDYRGAQQIIDNRVGDAMRSSTAIDGIISENADAINRCFNEEYRKGDANLGRLVVSFDVETNGTISDVKLIETTIQNERFIDCLSAVVRQFQFLPIQNDAAGVAKMVNVLYPLEFKERAAE